MGRRRMHLFHWHGTSWPANNVLSQRKTYPASAETASDVFSKNEGVGKVTTSRRTAGRRETTRCVDGGTLHVRTALRDGPPRTRLVSPKCETFIYLASCICCSHCLSSRPIFKRLLPVQLGKYSPRTPFSINVHRRRRCNHR